MARKNILPSGTGAATSATFVVKGWTSAPTTISLFGTLGSDEADLEIQASDGSWDAAFDSGGEIVLSATRPQTAIIGPGVYRLNAAARNAAWGADITR